MLSKFNGTSTPKGSYRAKTGDNDCNVNSSRYSLSTSLSTALCESIRYEAKSEQNVQQDLIPRVRPLCSLHPMSSAETQVQKRRKLLQLLLPGGNKKSDFVKKAVGRPPAERKKSLLNSNHTVMYN